MPTANLSRTTNFIAAWGIPLLCLFFSSYPTSAQTLPSTGLTVEARWMNGLILEHSPVVAPVAVSHPYAFELNLLWQTDGEKYWHQAYDLPRIGLVTGIMDYRNPEHLGRAIYSMGAFEFINARKGRHAFHLRLAGGLGYLTKIFELGENPKNLFIGSHVNFAVQTNFNYQLIVTEHISLGAGLSLTHFSNGAYKPPNKGINTLTGNLAISYRIGSGDAPRTDSLMRPEYRKSEWQFTASTGVKQGVIGDDSKYWLKQGSVYYNHRLSYKSALQAGVDVYDNPAIDKEFAEHPEIYVGEKEGSSRVGILIGHQLYIGRLSVVSQVGYYVYRPNTVQKSVYLRNGFRFYLLESRKLSIGWMLKTHYAKADFVEYSIAFHL